MKPSWTHLVCFAAALTAAACSSDNGDDAGVADTGLPADTGVRPDTGAPTDTGVPPDTGVADAGPPPDSGEDMDTGVADTGVIPVTVHPKSTKGGALAVNPTGDTLAVANFATDDVTLFALPALTERARVPVGDEPASLCWSSDGTTLWVVNRASANVTTVRAADTGSPNAAAPIDVGSEPGQCASSPTSASVYVANRVDGTVSVIDSASNTVSDTVDVGGAPYAVCVSNDGDEDDADETIYVTDFYARPNSGEREATDAARLGQVFRIASSNLGVQNSLTLDPFADSGIAATPGTGAYANQLYACALNGVHLYVTAVGASPEPFNNGTDFRQNIQGLVYAYDLNAGDFDAVRTVNVNALVDAQAAPRRFVSVPMDLDFAANSDLAYVVSTLSNSLQRIDFSVDPPTAGSPTANFLETGLSPTGVAIQGATAYVYNEVGRSVSRIDLATQTTADLNVVSAPQPTAPEEVAALRGQRFFNTGLGRWSANGWVGCLGCLHFCATDNVTWVFPAGPRQTVDTSATFDRTGTVQRVLNWTAIFDEFHDFELNTRGVANGTGAIVSTTDLNADGTPNTGARIDFVGANGFNLGSAAAVAATGAVPNDWDEIEAYGKTIRSPRGARRLGGDPVAGRGLFEDGRCHNCHGGVLWTLAERYYDPVLDQDNRTVTLESQGIADVGMVRADQVRTTDTSMIFVIENDANGAPQRHSCVVRIVGTFEATGPDNRGGPEIRQNGAAAQGVDGFSVPSLLGVNQGAPYLHNGAAETLEELLDPNGAFATHLRAGNQIFSPTPQQVADLIAFLRSIDDGTPTIAVPADQRFCPNGIQ